VRGADGNGSGQRGRLIATAVEEIGAGNDGSAIEAAHALARWSMRLLDVSGAGVMLTDDRGALRSIMVSSDLVDRLEAAELRQGRGPCVESHLRARAVIHADVQQVDSRWPEFGALAREGGVRGAHAIPVLDAGTAIGVLNLFRATTGGLNDPDTAVAHLLADTAGAAIGARAAPEALVDARELTAAVADAALIQRATGMLAVRLQVDLESARAVLRRVALDRGLGIDTLAGDVIAGTTTISLPLSIAPRPPDATGRD